MRKNKTVGEPFVGSYPGYGNVEFYIGTQRMNIFAGPGEKNNFSIHILSYGGEDGCDETVVFDYTIALTDKEYAAAMDSTFEDGIFVDNVDSLVAKRVAKDIFSTLLLTMGNPDGEPLEDRHRVEWKCYALYLIHERMAGRPIASYEPGFEPDNEK